MRLNGKRLIKSVVVASLTTATGLFVYKAYQTYKEVYSTSDDEEYEEVKMTLDEYERRRQDDEDTEEDSPIEGTRSHSTGDYVTVKSLSQKPEGYLGRDEAPTEEVEEEAYTEEELKEMDGEELLKFDKNSPEALEQWEEMNLRDLWEDGNKPEEYYIMKRLYTIPFTPRCQEDEMTLYGISDNRSRWFGEDSVHANKATVGDMVINYAGLMDYDLDCGMANAIAYLVKNIGIGVDTPDEEVERRRVDLFTHSIMDPNNGFGIFGLDSKEYKMYLDNGRLGFTAQYNVYIYSTLGDN